MNRGLRSRLQEDNLARLVRNDAFQFTDTFVPYASKEIGPYYVQSAAVKRDGRDYHAAVTDTLSFLRNSLDGRMPDVISGGESRDWIFSLPVASRIPCAHVMIYKDGRVVGALKEDMKGKNVVHIADLNNEGSSPRDMWVPVIRGAGGQIEDIFFYVDRMERGVQVIEDTLGLRRHAVVELDGNAWQYLLDQGVLTRRTYQHLNERMEDQDAWAMGMLRSPEGLETLAELFRNRKTVEKARGILDEGYPVLRKELIEKLTREKKIPMLDIIGECA
ncbi:MAG: hypothetical protein JSW08_02045 [archaeon]|nr:MAG: hypothetical protein JSW08_02045 [archaeon]